jgi:hypothetical protein
MCLYVSQYVRLDQGLGVGRCGGNGVMARLAIRDVWSGGGVMCMWWPWNRDLVVPSSIVCRVIDGMATSYTK